MAGNGKNTTTSSNSLSGFTTAAPYGPAQAPIQSALSAAQGYFDSGMGASPARQSDATQAGLSRLEDWAHYNDTYGSKPQYQQIINNGGYTGNQLNALNNIRSVANSNFNINEDPGFQQVVDMTRDNVNASASAAGRYGSGFHQGKLASDIGDLGARQYQSFLNRRDAANSNLFTMGQTGIPNLGAAYQGATAPFQTLLGVGQQRDAYEQSRINAPWDNLTRFFDIGSAAGALGGTQSISNNTTAQQTTPGQNPFLTALGYGATGLGLLGGI